MMEDLKVTDKKSEIGYYSGIVVSTLVLERARSSLRNGTGQSIRRLPTIHDSAMGAVIRLVTLSTTKCRGLF